MTSTANVAKLYNSIAEHEDSRLAEHPMERELTIRSIRDGLTSQGPGIKRIADIGGGPGRIAFPLADDGHQVDLVDLTPGLIAIAQAEQHRRQEAGQPVLSSLNVANVLDNPLLESASYEAVLLLGPLYHLLDEAERVWAVDNALVLAKPDGGLVYCAFVSVAAHLRDVVMRDPGRLVENADFYAKYLDDGRYAKYHPGLSVDVQGFHTNTSDIREFFARHFSTRAELVELRSTEGILGGGLDAKLESAGKETVDAWAKLMYERFSIGEEFLGNADHLLAVLKKR